MSIRPATTEADWNAARALIREYAAELKVAACFKALEEELATLPRRFEDPGAVLLLAGGAVPTGTISLRPLDGRIAEIARLYVRPEARAGGVGAALVRAVLEEGAARGYARVRLHTLPVMAAAVRLYRRLGFEPAAPDPVPPAPDALYFERALAVPR